ncbi:beta-amyrin synthase-like [Prunus yedoensis var. nudiflora]|uniref:Beta-amyrin synthase-like n=1 Tax=Prunus yedoensis var. nudiflora TaxID=2094558 RepID=A0A314UD40_PRUYE|nr:beta-amyrin synthase-like [Prunus yedoensis var. nudiflora]
MWKLKVADAGNDPYIYSTNDFVGGQIFEFDPTAGTPEELRWKKLVLSRPRFLNVNYGLSLESKTC